MSPRYLAVLLFGGMLPAALAQSTCATSPTGPQVGTSFQPLDTLIQNAMKTANVQGGAFAVTYQGRLVLAHAYGCADVAGNLPAQPDSLFRIASVSKTFTAISILQLYEALEIGHLRRKVGASDFAELLLPDALLYFWRLLNHAATAGERDIWKRPFRSAGACSPPAN